MVLALRHGVLPQTLHVDRPSSQVDWTDGDIELLSQAQTWPETGRPRRAGVSSFGISGTNAHVVLEQAPAEPQAEPARPAGEVTPVVSWVLSGRSRAAVRAQATRLLSSLDKQAGWSPADVGLALATTRSVFDHHAVVTAAERADFVRGLEDLVHDRPSAVVTEGSVQAAGRLAFSFAGQGTQRPGMGRELYDRFPVFARTVDEIAAHLEIGRAHV